MAKKKLGIGTIDINKKFKDEEEAIKYARNLQQDIRYMSKTRKWQVSAVIGISRLAKNVSTIDYEITGKKGRPRKKVNINNNEAYGWYNGKYMVDWHIHIVIVSMPSYAARNSIKDYIDKNWTNIGNAHEVSKFDLNKINKGKIYKKKCNVKMSDYIIEQSERVLFCNYNYSGEKDLKYTLKQYYYGYLKMKSAKTRLVRKHIKKPLSEEEYLKRIEKIDNDFLKIENYFLEFSKDEDEKMQKQYLENVKRQKIIERYEELDLKKQLENNKVQNLRRTIIEDDSPF